VSLVTTALRKGHSQAEFGKEQERAPSSDLWESRYSVLGSTQSPLKSSRLKPRAEQKEQRR
jgi:hypothetical protein